VVAGRKGVRDKAIERIQRGPGVCPLGQAVGDIDDIALMEDVLDVQCRGVVLDELRLGIEMLRIGLSVDLRVRHYNESPGPGIDRQRRRAGASDNRGLLADLVRSDLERVGRIDGSDRVVGAFEPTTPAGRTAANYLGVRHRYQNKRQRDNQ
jgi:hypothetical protein